ncbi:MAG: acyl-CoA dehydrogenase [Proteobacteria bacterium]|nr:MAG: acyl-CoA dehydrogenase [Pseudomonadota bacterium]
MASGLIWLLVALASVWTLAMLRAPGWGWWAAFAVLIACARLVGGIGDTTALVLLAVSLLLVVPLVVAPLRRLLISRHVLAAFRKVLPEVSRTEQEALDAGTVWWDGDLFSGNPDWNKLLDLRLPALTAEEQAFLDGPVEELCALIDDWKVTHEWQDLPPNVWEFLQDKGFFGMIIPRRYGGLEFSALAHSAVVVKLASRSLTAAVTVMVPNSLGPAELLLHYGTDQQKAHYLPRLARGEEIPCFALTGPTAGSDAAAIPDTGVVCHGEYAGKSNVLGIRLNWNKRYITLGPVATVIGLAFRLLDPDHLLGEEDDLGITCALIPADTRGVVIGRRHLPLNAVFQNGPTQGHDVFIPLEWIIGGLEQAGNGWRMLMESLAAGRSISLPALSVGAAKVASRATGAYSRVRKQFKTPIGRFEGIQEPLARIGGMTYMMDAARVMTCGALDLGEKPSVISAILKYHLTEMMRQIVNDAMDIQGGSGICLGPRNYLGRAYQAVPISITVEGANILTRSLIIFGQGAIRCHPYLLREMRAAHAADGKQALTDFDQAFFGHIRHAVASGARTLFYGLGGWRLVRVPEGGPVRHYYKHFTRVSCAFSLLTEMSMMTLGGELKRRERLSARLGDVLSCLYLGSAILKRFDHEGRMVKDLPFVHWGCQQALYLAEKRMIEALINLPSRGLARILRGWIFPAGRTYFPPDDRLETQVAELLLRDSGSRDRLTAGLYIPAEADHPLRRLEQALHLADGTEETERQLRHAQRDGIIAGADEEELLVRALAAGVVSEAQAKSLREYWALVWEIIQVDDFPPDFGRENQEAPCAQREQA